jgi:hypothetical protein
MLQLLRAHDSSAGKGQCLISPDTIQHINFKIFIADPEAIELAEAVGVFHQWIRDSVCPEMLIDVADYRHVPAGPGVMLIGHEANYSFDHRDNRLGLLYNRKAALEGTFQSRLAQAHHAALEACDRLEREAPFHGKLKFDRNTLEVFINDRLLAPNDEETWQALRPEFEKYFSGYKIRREGEPRDLFRVGITLKTN